MMRHSGHSAHVHKLGLENLNTAVEEQLKEIDELCRKLDQVGDNLPHLQLVADRVFVLRPFLFISLYRKEIRKYVDTL